MKSKVKRERERERERETERDTERERLILKGAEKSPDEIMGVTKDTTGNGRLLERDSYERHNEQRKTT